ncbi:MAG TPA: CocE/NonD family hydrolase, partial [Ktedonobacterales bacterium]|nr:CocE/NonD family hydrolase [Ktedonobacterales bacterium]
MADSSGGTVRIAFDQRIPMRDGVTLSADIYFPTAAAGDGGTGYPALVSRTPYVKANTATLESGRYYAEHGYVFVAQDVRGRGDSDGQFVPYFHDGRDGFDTIEWCAAQPWSNGKVGTTGGSYLGHIQWLAALQQPPHLKAMVSMVTPSDPFVETPTGLPSPMHLCWLHYVSGRMNQPMEAVDWASIYDHLPLVSMDERAGRRNQHWRANIAHPQRDEYWEPLCYQHQFARLDVPVLHISGWYDDEQVGTPLNYIGMTTQAATPEARASQRLLMGPWGHQINTTAKLGELIFGAQALIDLRAEITGWFDRWLKEGPANVAAPVRIFVMGANTWRDEQEWPLARTRWTPYYLRSGGHANSRFGDGALATTPPAEEPADNYRYDPARPVPFITEPTSSQIGGPDDYTAIERRDD